MTIVVDWDVKSQIKQIRNKISSPRLALMMYLSPLQWTMDGKKQKKKAKTISKKTQRKSVVESSESESEAGEIKSEPEEGKKYGSCTDIWNFLP